MIDALIDAVAGFLRLHDVCGDFIAVLMFCCRGMPVSQHCCILIPTYNLFAPRDILSLYYIPAVICWSAGGGCARRTGHEVDEQNQEQGAHRRQRPAQGREVSRRDVILFDRY